MDIRKGLARIFGRSKGKGSNEAASKAPNLVAASKELLQAARRIETSVFDHNMWTREIARSYKDSLHLGDIIKPPEEKICPLTKQLIVEKLRDVAADNPYSIRQILSAVFEDGVKDDYELLDKLEKFNKPDPLHLRNGELTSFDGIVWNARKSGKVIKFKPVP